MKNSQSEVWTHLVLKTKNNQPLFYYTEILAIQQALEDFADQHDDPPMTFSVLPHQVYLLTKLPESLTFNGLVEHLKTFIKVKLGQKSNRVESFEWEKEDQVFSVSINKLTTEKIVIHIPFIKTKDRDFDESVKYTKP